MKSFAMLKSEPVAPATGEARYFIDGERVTQGEYRKLCDNADRRDSFSTYRFGDRWHFRSVCYA